MTGWGRVIAIEAQERIYYALAGNIALNNCFNIRAIHAAVAERDGALRIPEPDYLAPASFGSLELRWSEGAEFIGQRIDYADERMVPVRAVALDSLGLTRVDLLKIDVEGMEIEALAGACALITAHHPLILVEHIKSGRDRLGTILGGFGYAVHEFGLNLLAVHPSDPSGTHIKRQRG